MRDPRRTSATTTARHPQVDVLVIALFATCQLYTPVFGQLYFLETGMFVAALVLLATHRSTAIETRAPLRLLLVLLMTWLAMSLVSDFVNHSSDLDTLRGAVRAGFLLTDILLLSWWSRRTPGVLHSMWIGYAASFGVAYVLQPTEVGHSEVWKFTLAVPVAFLCVVWLDRSGLSSRVQVAVLVGLAALDFVLGARSIALIVLGAAGLTWAASRGFGKPGLVKMLVVVVLAGACGVGITLGYDRLAGDGAFGVHAQIKASYQADGAYGSLLGGRPEAFVATRAIANSPLMGNGSYSLPDAQEMARASQALDDLGYEQLATALPNIRNYHSELLGTWAENGIAAAAFWLAVLGLCVAAVRRVMAGEARSVCLVGLLVAMLVWDLLFSPFGADRRLFDALGFVTIVHFLFTDKPVGRREDDHRHDQLQPGGASGPVPGQRPGARPGHRSRARRRGPGVDRRLPGAAHRLRGPDGGNARAGARRRAG